MAISVNWATKVITIPQADLTFISGTLYELDTDQLRLDLKALEDDEDGIVFDDTHRHNTEVIISGVTFARTFEIINGYTVTFENGAYRVRLAGTNNNISDVANLNTVSVLSQNSAGLINNTASLARGLVITGSTTITVRTDSTKADGFFDGLFVQFTNSAGAVVRRVDQYRNTNGEMDLNEDLPFTPAAGDPFIVLSGTHGGLG